MIVKENPFFIVGCARSGTSLLGRMLNAHPRIAVPYESHLFNTFCPLLHHYGDLAERANSERLIDNILSTAVMRDWRPRLDRSDVFERLHPKDFGSVVDALISSRMASQGKKRWGEKTPHHVDFWREILESFPNARFLYIVRDGRDVALSLKRARFGPKTIYTCARYWLNYLQRAEALKAGAGKDRVYTVRYEALLQNPEDTLRNVCGFLEEEYSEQMLAFYQNSAEYMTDDQNRLNLKRPLMQNNVQKWRRAMRPQALHVFEGVAGGGLKENGYELALPEHTLSPIREAYCKGLEWPLPKLIAILKNWKGLKDFIIRLRIRLKLFL